MDTLERKNQELWNPTEISPDYFLVAFLVERLHKLSKEAFNDFMRLGLYTNQCETQEELLEIMETMREVLFPELIGNIKMGHAGSIHQTDNLQKRNDYIGKVIKEKRKEQGLTQKQLAQNSELPQSHISRLEAGVHSPSHKTLQKIAKALKISIDKLDPAY
jgi:DNA-binding XRE family transcriptional regulator